MSNIEIPLKGSIPELKTALKSKDSQDSTSSVTKRVSVSELEELLYEKIPVLDHGFIRIVDYMGNDSAVVQAARVSYGSGTKKVQEDRNLIFYLMRHRHTTPFEMCEIKFHVKLPIFIARQWVRHRMASINEYSARYSILDKEFYVPNLSDIGVQSESNKQGRAKEDITLEKDSNWSRYVLDLLKEDSQRLYDHYEYLLNDQTSSDHDELRPGLSRELARMNLSLNYYTQFYWKIDLHNLLHFLELRSHPHAQLEIQKYALTLLDIVQKWVPFVFEAFKEYRLEGVNFSKTAIQNIKILIKGKKIDQTTSNMSKREWDEFCQILNDD